MISIIPLASYYKLTSLLSWHLFEVTFQYFNCYWTRFNSRVQEIFAAYFYQWLYSIMTAIFFAIHKTLVLEFCTRLSHFE